MSQTVFRWSNKLTLRLHGMSWAVKATCFKAPGVSLGGSGVSIGGVRILRVCKNLTLYLKPPARVVYKHLSIIQDLKQSSSYS